jgi:hypothetical protein
MYELTIESVYDTAHKKPLLLGGNCLYGCRNIFHTTYSYLI